MPCGITPKLSRNGTGSNGEVGSCSTLVLWAGFVSKVMLINFQCLANPQPKFPHMLCPNVYSHDNVPHSGLALQEHWRKILLKKWKILCKCLKWIFITFMIYDYYYYFLSPWRRWCVLLEHSLSWKSSWNQSLFFIIILRSSSAGSAAGAEWCWHLLPPSQAPGTESWGHAKAINEKWWPRCSVPSSLVRALPFPFFIRPGRNKAKSTQ